jgi:hypothetical protein
MKLSQAVIIILLVANLVATVWFGLNGEKPYQVSMDQKTSSHELPSVINSDVRDNIYNEFARAFNSQDYDALYDMFGPAAKAQIKKKESLSEFEKLAKYFHSVEEGGFTHSKLAGTQGNTNIYILYYAVKLAETSAFGDKGTLKVTVAIQANKFQIYGIKLKAG